MTQASAVFTKEWLADAFPAQRTEDFFDALFGGTEEGAYDIELEFVADHGQSLEFALNLCERPGKCLVCNLTYGLPQVFSRHPIINIKGLAKNIAEAVGQDPQNAKWELKNTKEISKKMHCIPLVVSFA